MLSPFCFLSRLPEELCVSIFEKTGSHPSVCIVSKEVQRIMEKVYANLYRAYQALNHSPLNFFSAASRSAVSKDLCFR